MTAVTSAKGPRTYANTLAPLDAARGEIADGVGSAAFMAYVHPAADVRAAGHLAEQRLERWLVDLPFDPAVAAAVTEFATTDEAASLDGERSRLLAFTRRDIRLAGHELPPHARDEVRAAAARLVDIGVRFSQHIADVDDVLAVSEDDLDGLPDEYRDGLARDGDGALPDHDGLSRRRAIPRTRPAARPPRGPDPVVQQPCRVAPTGSSWRRQYALRERIAELFGRPSWAHHTMDEKMAHDPETVDAFYAELVPELTPKARAEIDVMAKLLAADTGDDQLQPWDWRYYDTELRKSEFGVDPREVAAYFPLQQVLDGLLEITGEAFGLDYEPLDDVPVWHPDVLTFAIADRATGERIAITHMDLHPREGKYSHAAAFNLVPGRRLDDGSYRTPVSCIVANFTKPSAGRPSLLTHDEVVTFFHEFGHILHQTLTRAETARFSGTRTERDFVEAPSQIMEHWCWRPDVLARFAFHYRTGEPIPQGLVEQLVAARNLNVGVAKLRQVQFGVLDMGLHGPRRPEEVTDGERDLDAILRRAEAVSLMPHQDGTFMPANFGHLLTGYDAGYYGYLWSEVFGDDMFSRFAAEGVTDPVVGRRYRTEILERGGSVSANEMLERFLGRRPSNEAFLVKLGITR